MLQRSWDRPSQKGKQQPCTSVTSHGAHGGGNPGEARHGKPEDALKSRLLNGNARRNIPGFV